MGPLREGERIYHRRMDLFGSVKSVDATHALVKYEYPYDSEAEPVRVSKDELISASEMRGY